MNNDRERKLNLSDPGRDAAGDEIEMLLRDAESDEEELNEDAGFNSFLERLPVKRPPDRRGGR